MNDPNATLSFVQAVKQVLNNYANFSGRARRSEYWYYALFSMIVAFIAQVLDLILGLNIEGIGYGYLYIICALALIVPSLSVSVRRLHDINKSGWNLLWGLIPIIGGILLIVWFCKDSIPETNKYGLSPKYQSVEE